MTNTRKDGAVYVCLDGELRFFLNIDNRMIYIPECTNYYSSIRTYLISAGIVLPPPPLIHNPPATAPPSGYVSRSAVVLLSGLA